jgi:hypothetical protein
MPLGNQFQGLRSMAQVVGRLPLNCEALCSNSNTPKTNQTSQKTPHKKPNRKSEIDFKHLEFCFEFFNFNELQFMKLL